MAGPMKPKEPSKAHQSGSNNKYAALLGQIQSFVRKGGSTQDTRGPTTDEILAEFDHVANNDAAIFRRLLGSVAKVQSGRWHLKEQDGNGDGNK